MIITCFKTLEHISSIICSNNLDKMVAIAIGRKFFFFSFRPFPLVRGGHSVSSFSTSFYLQCPSSSHQLPSYLLLPHLKIFSLVSLFSSFLAIPFPSSFFLHTLIPTSSLLMTCPYHLSLPSLIFIPNRSTLTVLLMCSFLILSFLVTPIANLSIFISATSISST